MQRHELEPVSLLSGLVFTGIAVCALVSRLGDIHLHRLAVLPAGLIVLGVLALLVAVRRAGELPARPSPGAASGDTPSDNPAGQD